MINQYEHTNTKGRTYWLHTKEIVLKSNKPRRIYFFAKALKQEFSTALPAGYMVSEGRNGLPLLKRI